MNWRSHNKSCCSDKGRVNYIDRLIIKSASQVAKLATCLIGAGLFLSGDADSQNLNSEISLSQLDFKIAQVAADISVKILDLDFLGSGFIVQKSDAQSAQKYTVLTNQHVLRAGEAPYSIKTPDGKTYLAEIVSELTDDNHSYDLAILEFSASQTYSTAKIGNSLFLSVGEPIFAAGFPFRQTTTATTSDLTLSSLDNISQRLSVKEGRIAIILSQALEEGYQIGYTNDVEKGMSGGPLINSQGEVVGINGKHAYPLWESPEIYQDGSHPCPALQDLIIRSSLAIPIEKSIELKPQLKFSSSDSDIASIPNVDWLSEDYQVVNQMQAEARETMNKCKNEN